MGDGGARIPARASTPGESALPREEAQGLWQGHWHMSCAGLAQWRAGTAWVCLRMGEPGPSVASLAAWVPLTDRMVGRSRFRALLEPDEPAVEPGPSSDGRNLEPCSRGAGVPAGAVVARQCGPLTGPWFEHTPPSLQGRNLGTPTWCRVRASPDAGAVKVARRSECGASAECGGGVRGSACRVTPAESGRMCATKRAHEIKHGPLLQHFRCGAPHEYRARMSRSRRRCDLHTSAQAAAVAISVKFGARRTRHRTRARDLQWEPPLEWWQSDTPSDSAVSAVGRL
jgi:hypothetical protein